MSGGVRVRTAVARAAARSRPSRSERAAQRAARNASTRPPALPGASQEAAPKRLAPHHLRLFALLVDYAILAAVTKLLQQALLGQHWDLTDAALNSAPLIWRWLGITGLLLLAKDVLGVSPGKLLLGIAVRRADDPQRSPALWQDLLRNLSLLALPVDAVLVFTDPYLRRWGDLWAGTVVVQRPNPSAPFQRLMGAGMLFLSLVLAALLLTGWNVRRTAAYQTALPAALASAALQGQVGQPVQLDPAADLQLNVTPLGGAAVLTFDASGPKGKAQTRVSLRLERQGGAAHWEVLAVQVLAPGNAPQQPAPAKPS